MTTTKGFSIKLNGIEIKNDTIYEVKPKYDPDAPDGFRKHNTSKLLSKGISEYRCIPFDERSDSWVTGFEETSPCYTNVPVEQVKTLVKQLNDHVVKPFEKTRKAGVLSPNSENKFWATYGVDIYAGKIFNTRDPKDLLDLVMAVSNYFVSEKDNKENKKPESKRAKYDIVNRESVTSVKEDRQYAKLMAMGEFKNLMDKDKDKLLNILEWLELNEDRTATDKSLTSIAMLFLESADITRAHEYVKTFSDAVAKANTESGEKEIQFVVDLNNLKRNKVLKYEYKEWYLNDIALGTRMKEGAYKAMQDPELASAIREEISKLEDKKAALKK